VIETIALQLLIVFVLMGFALIGSRR